MLATFGLVLGFRESTNLAAAYGVAVTATMVITTILAYVVARQVWGWPRSAGGAGDRLLPDGRRLVLRRQHHQGGGRRLVPAAGRHRGLHADVHLEEGAADPRRPGCRRTACRSRASSRRCSPDSPIRVPGTAIFLARDPNGTPPSLLHNLKHNKVLHSKVVVLTLVTEEVPTVPATETVEIQPLGQGVLPRASPTTASCRPRRCRRCSPSCATRGSTST